MTQLLEKHKDSLTKTMFFMTFVVSYVFSVIGKIFVEAFNINQTMGWKWSVLHTWIDNIPSITTLSFSGAYLLLLFFKIKTNSMLSAIHLSLIALSAFLYNFQELDLRIILSFFCLSIVVFLTNCYNSLLDKKKDSNSI